MITVNKILVPTDFSKNAKAAIDYGCELARQFGAELHLLNIVENNIAMYSAEMDVFGTANNAFNVVEAEKRAIERLQTLPVSIGTNSRVVRQTEISTPCSGVTLYAKKHDIDLIVISTHGHTGLTHFLLGSVAENIVRTAPCPVLTVRPEGHQFVDDNATSQPATA